MTDPQPERMAERMPERIVLELDPGEPIHGRIRRSGEAPEPFHGWLEFASKLERAARAVADGDRNSNTADAT